MISHDRAQELISARMDAPLTPAEHRELQGHLATCDSCRLFVVQADHLARDLQVLPRLAASPAVSRAVMMAVSADTSGWGWLRRGLQTLSSPGMAVASALALVVAMAGSLIIALNAPGNDGIVATEPEGTIAALADVPLPTAVPTETPAPAPDPTATRASERKVTSPPTKAPARTPTPQPTATRAPIEVIAEPTTEPAIAPEVVEEPIIEPVAEEPVLAMAPEEPVDTAPSTELAQAAEPPPSGEGASEVDAAPATDDGRGNDGGRKDRAEEAVAEPVPTESLPVPDEAIAALESAGASTDVSLPPAAPLPMPPEQAFLPITPTPVSDGTPTPEPETQADAPQLAEDWSSDPGVTALAPEVTDATVADVTVIETDEITSKEKRDRSSKDGKSHENQQSAYVDDAMGWSMEPVDMAQSAALLQTTDETAAATTSAEGLAEPTATGALEPQAEPEPQYDPATGLEIDPATGLLIDPATGYLLDLVNGRIIHPATGYLVHPMTGLLIDPATGAQLDPVTLAIVIPAGFGSDTPHYAPGSDSMRGTIETVVDETYDNATYKVIPGTDGPAQPVGEIVVPTESGDAIEMS
jgi:Putative zinc-finger